MILTKQDIAQLPHDKICGMTQTELDHFAETTLSKRCGSWLLPQLVAAFGSWTLARDVNGCIDVRETLKRNCENNIANTSYWKLSRVNRSLLVVKQTAQPEYGTLTPLILAGFKRMQGIQYEQWRGLANLEYILEPRLYKAATADCSGLSLGSERLQQIRTQGLTARSGAKAGQLKSAESTWSLTGIADTELSHLPKLTTTMLTQIWLAHPSLRTSMMILDPQNWDRMPEPLLATDVFKKPEQHNEKPIKSTNTLLPWM